MQQCMDGGSNGGGASLSVVDGYAVLRIVSGSSAM